MAFCISMSIFLTNIKIFYVKFKNFIISISNISVLVCHSTAHTKNHSLSAMIMEDINYVQNIKYVKYKLYVHQNTSQQLKQISG